MARKIHKKLSKELKSLLIGLLIGDGTITNHPDFRICHSIELSEYLNWKINLLNKFNLSNSGIKVFKSTSGYNKGSNVIYVRVKTNSTIKALRRIVYKPNKIITKQLLLWLTPQELAIWYMDDGCINVNTSKQRSSIQHSCKIATCVDINTVEEIIDYFYTKWNIKFRKFKEGSNTYSVSTSSEEDCLNFIKIIKPYIEQVPSLLYKIRDNFTKNEFIAYQLTDNFRSARHIIGD